MKEFWLAFYAFWRSLFSPIVWRMFYKRKRYTRDEEARAWCNKFLTSEMTVAHTIIHPVEYKADRLKGKIDASIPPRYAHVFFAELEEGRDCDDFARMWTLWGEKHEYEAREWLVTSKKKGEFFKRAHMVTTLSKYGEHWLVDYTPFGPHNVLEGALGDLSRRYKDGFILAEYKWRREW